MRRTIGLAAAAVLLLAACGGDGDDEGGGVDGGGDDGTGEAFESPSEVIGDADEGIEGVQAVRVAQHDHVDGEIDYGLRPPAGGAHAHVWWNCGFYDEPVPDVNAVHTLEHGAVWLAYAPDLDEGDVEVLHDLTRETQKVLSSPYEGLDDGVAVVATAWARQLTLDSVDDPRLAEFVARYEGGSQSPEGEVPCSGTELGEPIP
jgi:hypothetical protein